MESYNHQLDWYHESQISKKLVNYFELNNYKIIKNNSENISARGADLIVCSNSEYLVIEVKGYPTTFHTKGVNKGLPKPTKPKLQAKHWFSEAIFSSIYNYSRYKDSQNLIIAIAFPLNERYKELIKKVEDYFTDNDLNFRVYFVDENGSVLLDNLNKLERNK